MRNTCFTFSGTNGYMKEQGKGGDYEDSSFKERVLVLRRKGKAKQPTIHFEKLRRKPKSIKQCDYQNCIKISAFICENAADIYQNSNSCSSNSSDNDDGANDGGDGWVVMVETAVVANIY